MMTAPYAPRSEKLILALLGAALIAYLVAHWPLTKACLLYTSDAADE